MIIYRDDHFDLERIPYHEKFYMECNTCDHYHFPPLGGIVHGKEECKEVKPSDKMLNLYDMLLYLDRL